MKNKFKKSKIIVPALALITATTVASVTGTVAWFTASRTATVQTGNFTVGTNEGNLKVSVQNGVGVTQAVTADTDITLAVGKTSSDSNILLDASYDGTKFYTDVAEGETPQSSGDKYKEVNQRYDTSSKYFYAFSWQFVFQIDVSSNDTNANYDIFFDAASSTKESHTSNSTTDAGLRIRMGSQGTSSTSLLDTSVNPVTWAPYSDNAGTTGYVSSTTATTAYTTASATAHGLIPQTTPDALKNKASDETSSNTNHSRGDYLGTCALDNDSKNQQLTINVVVWYEGLDASIVTTGSEIMSSISAKMQFYARAHKA